MVKLLTLQEIREDLSDKNFLVLKYVRVEVAPYRNEYRFLMAGNPDGPTHHDMANGEQAFSAGFCTVSLPEKTVSTNGKSTTLNLEPAPEDANVLTHLFFQVFTKRIIVV